MNALSILKYWVERSKPEDLTPAQQEVLYLLSTGLTYEEIADERCCSVKTVRSMKGKIIACIGETEFRHRVYRNG